MERKIARMFGTKRVPLSGSNSGHDTCSDSLHKSLYIECKYRAKMAVETLFEDTEKKANKEGKTPLLVLRVKNKRGVLFVTRPEYIETLSEEIKCQPTAS